MPEKPKSSLWQGISLRPRRHVELITPLSLKQCHEKLAAAFPGLTTSNDGEDVIRFHSFALVETDRLVINTREAASTTGYLKSLADGTTLVSATASIMPHWHRQYGVDDIILFAFCLFVYLVILTIIIGCLTLIPPLHWLLQSDEPIKISLIGGVVGLLLWRYGYGLLMDYLILTRYRDDLVTAIQAAFPAQLTDKQGKNA